MALTCILCRIMESIVQDCMLQHVISNHMLSEHQHGILQGSSTGYQILECLNDKTQNMKAEKCADICCIDFSRAFDQVLIQNYCTN